MVCYVDSPHHTEDLHDTDSLVYSHDVEGGLTFIKSERQLLMETALVEGNLPLDNRNRGETCSQTESETHVKVKSEKVESEDSSSNSGETRHWVVCQNGVLKEVKVEPTDWTPDTRETSTSKNEFM